MKCINSKCCAIFIVLATSCSAQEVLRYDFQRFLMYEKVNREPQNLKDSVSLYIESVLANNKADKPYFYFPEINALDVSFYMSNVEGDTYLGGIGDFVIPFMHSSQKLMALGVFLRKEYKLRTSSFDQILRQCIFLEQNNLTAYYLLSELRYTAGYKMEAKYLMEILYRKAGQNKEIKKLYERMRKTEPASYQNLKEFLKEEAYYRD